MARSGAWRHETLAILSLLNRSRMAGGRVMVEQPLPTGTVAFLFTDIEGSTKRWQRHREAMEAAVARHDHLLRAAIEGHGGYVFKTVGDAFCAAFDTVPVALAAALTAQTALALALADEGWNDAGPIRVRMAVHVGA